MVETYLRLYCNYRQDDWDEHLAAAEFSFSSSVMDSTGHTLFFVDLGWEPKHPLDLLSSRIVHKVQSVEELQVVLKSSFRDAQLAYSHARNRQLKQASKKYRNPKYKVQNWRFCHGEETCLA